MCATIRAHDMPSVSGITRENIWTRHHQRLDSRRPVRRGCFREALLKQGGMRRPASLCMHTDAREAFGQHRPPATTSGTCERSNARPKDTAHVHRPEVSPRRARGQKTAAVERRKASVPRRAACVSGLRGDARAYVIGPLPNGCRRTRAPLGAPLPRSFGGKLAKLGGRSASREG